MSAATAIEPTPAQPPGAARPGAPPGAPPGAQSFHGALEGELARTAPAEGQTERSPEEASKTEPSRDRRHADAEGADAQAGAAQAVVVQAVAASTASALPIPSRLLAPTTPQGGAGANQGEEDSAPTGPSLSLSSPRAQPLEATSPGADLPLAGVGTEPAEPSLPSVERDPRDGAGTGIAISRSQENQARPGVEGAQPAPPRSPALAAGQSSAGAPEAPSPEVAVPQGPAQQGDAGVEPGIRARGGTVKWPLGSRQAEATPDTESAAPQASTAAAARTDGRPAGSPLPVQPHEGGAAPEPQPVSQGPSAVTAPSSSQGAESAPAPQLLAGAPAAPVAPAPPAGGAQAPVVASGVGMQEMIESVRATIEVAARRGMSQARIALQPAELGEIRVHLSQGADGLIARVTAGTDAAAQALASGRAELHHSLSTIGPSLLRLEIGSFNQSGQGRERSAGDASASQSGKGATGQDASIEEDEQATPPAAAAATGPRGELVDVLA